MPIIKRTIPMACGFAATLLFFAIGVAPAKADCQCNGMQPNRKVTKSPIDNEYCLEACDVNRYISVDQCNMSAYCRSCNGNDTYRYCSVILDCYYGGLRTEYCTAPGHEW